MVFSSCNLLTGLTSDRVAGKSRYFGRHTLFAIGTLLFSTCLCLMGLSNAYWQLVVLRMGIAAGEAVCRYSKKSKQTAQYINKCKQTIDNDAQWGLKSEKRCN